MRRLQSLQCDTVKAAKIRRGVQQGGSGMHALPETVRDTMAQRAAADSAEGAAIGYYLEEHGILLNADLVAILTQTTKKHQIALPYAVDRSIEQQMSDRGIKFDLSCTYQQYVQKMATATCEMPTGQPRRGDETPDERQLRQRMEAHMYDTFPPDLYSESTQSQRRAAISPVPASAITAPLRAHGHSRNDRQHIVIDEQMPGHAQRTGEVPRHVSIQDML